MGIGMVFATGTHSPKGGPQEQNPGVTMNDRANENVQETLALAERMLALADRGDGDREDVGCGVLYGTVRDCAYKIMQMAEAELQAHDREQKAPVGGGKVSDDVGLYREGAGPFSSSA